MENDKRFCVSKKWKMRHDSNYLDSYILYNIESRLFIRVTPALYSLVSVFYNRSISFYEVKKYFESKGVYLKWSSLDEIEKEFGLEKLFVASDCAYHERHNNSSIEKLYDVPVMSFPMDAEILLTHNCNLKCKHCFQSSSLHSDKRTYLSTETWIDIFKQLESFGVLSVVISGGEPLMYPYFNELFREVTTYNLSISFLTNGMLINEENIDIFRHKNVFVTVSLDGSTKQEHEALRGKNTFNLLENKLSLMITHGVNLNIAHTLNRNNLSSIDNLVEYLVTKGIKHLSINFIEPEGRASINCDLLLTPAEEAEAYKRINYLKIKYADQIYIDFPSLSYKKNLSGFSASHKVYCAAGTKRIAISTDGCVYPCVYAFNIPNLMMGDLKFETLQDIWGKDKWNIMRGGIKLSQIETCSSCKMNMICNMRNCRIKFYTEKGGLYEKPRNCLKDKIC